MTPGRARIPAEVAREARAILLAEGDTSARVTARHPGGVSDVYVIRTAPSQQTFALKVARDGEADLTGQAELLTAAGGRASPRVISVFGDGRAYLMEHLQGRQLWSGCASPTTDTRRLALRVFEARAEYVERTGRPFGDFHPGNVIVTLGRAVQLMDPKVVEPSDSGLIEDLAHWTYNTSWSAVGWGVPHPLRAANLVRVNTALLDAATDGLSRCEREELLGEVFARARAALDLLGESPWPRDRLSVRPARAVLRMIERIAHRR